MLIRSNAPNRLLGAHLQRMLGGEYHETCFRTCWSRRARRRGTLQRSSVCDTCRRSGSGRKLSTFSRLLTSATNGAIAGTNRPTPMATVTTTRIIMEVGVGTIAGDTGTAGTTGTITIAAGDMADTTGISGNSEERGFGPFLSSPPRLNRRPHRGQRRRTRRRDDRTTSGLGWLISCLRASRSKPPVRIGSPCRAPAPAP